MRSDSFTAQVLDNLARTSPPFSAGEAPAPARSPGSSARTFRSWLLHALAFTPVSDDTSHQDEMRVSPRGVGRPAMAHARTARPNAASPGAKTPPRQEAPIPLSAADLLALARRTLETAGGLDDSLQQYALTHHAALQAAAAVIRAKQRPEHRLGRRARIRSSWDLLPEVAPEFAEYGAYFEKTTVKMIRAEAGIAGAIDTHELTELRGITAEFVRKVAALDEVKTTGTQPGDGDGAATMRRTS